MFVQPSDQRKTSFFKELPSNSGQAIFKTTVELTWENLLKRIACVGRKGNANVFFLCLVLTRLF